MKPAFEGGVFNTVPPPESRVSIVHHNPSKLSSVEDFEGWGGTETALTTVAEDPVAWSSTVPAVDARPVLVRVRDVALSVVRGVVHMRG